MVAFAAKFSGSNGATPFPIGSARSTIAIAATDIREGVVSMTHCWGSENLDADPADDGSCTNRLVDSETDLSQIVGMARQSAIPVRVAKVPNS